MTQTQIEISGKLFARVTNIADAKKTVKQLSALGNCSFEIEVYMDYSYNYSSYVTEDVNNIVGASMRTYDIDTRTSSDMKIVSKKIRAITITAIFKNSY